MTTDLMSSEPLPKMPRGVERPKRTIGAGTLMVLLLSSTVLAAGSGLFYMWSLNQLKIAEQKNVLVEDMLEAKEARAREVARQRGLAEAERAMKQRRLQEQNEAAMAVGWQLTPAEGIYYAPYEGEYYCDIGPSCALFTIMTIDPCPLGISVTLSMLDGDLSLEAVSGVTAGLGAEGQASMKLEATRKGSDRYRITDAHCIG